MVSCSCSRPGVVDRVCGPLKSECLHAWCVGVEPRNGAKLLLHRISSDEAAAGTLTHRPGVLQLLGLGGLLNHVSCEEAAGDASSQFLGQCAS